MTKIALFAGGDLSYYETNFDYFIGIDRGSLFLLKNGLPLDMAVGDFDSVSNQELAQIKASCPKVIQAKPEKDDTDTELALKVIFQEHPDAQVTIFGAFGGRIDHMMSNVFLPSDPDLAPSMRQIALRDTLNLIHYYPAGRQTILPQKGMTYVSFMPESDAPLTIFGARYELSAVNFFQKKIYSSNEFLDQPIEVELDSGYLIVIYSKDRSWHDLSITYHRGC